MSAKQGIAIYFFISGIVIVVGALDHTEYSDNDDINNTEVPSEDFSAHSTTPRDEDADKKWSSSDPIFVDFLSLIEAYKNTTTASTNDAIQDQTQQEWRQMGFQQKIYFLFNNSRMTDCTFVVGPDGSEESVSAHAIVLAISSPVFEFTLRQNRNFRIKGMTAHEFRQILHLIYAGDFCINSFEDACSMLKHGALFGLDGVQEVARGYMFKFMYPHHIWHAYQCAKQVYDRKLFEIAWKLITKRTDAAIGDQKFNEITQSDLFALLSQEDLTVSSELQLYEAVVRWALVQSLRKYKKTTPQLMREVIGVEALKLVRFLNLTADEIRKVFVGYQILTPEETLAVLFNINKFGSVDLPKTISSNNASRLAISLNHKNELFEVIAARDSCAAAVANRSDDDTFSVFSTSLIPILGRSAALTGIQIPKSYEAGDNCTSVKEHFDVFVLDYENNIIDNVTYNQVPPCKARRFQNRGRNDYVSDSKLISVKLSSKSIDLTSSEKRYKVKIVFKDSKTYPASLRTQSDIYFITRYKESISDFNDGYIHVMQPNSFIYSMVLYY